MLETLKKKCTILTGEQTDDILEETALLVLRMFLEHDVVMIKHLNELRRLFGKVTTTSATTICNVRKFSRIIFC